ncbi:MAG: secondary thiamine-phosphate synthase enzyme YjbQ [bacterium]|nr:secondary thiamine-phosphate synthase enzyme YjbQ [bacterium]
MNNLIEFSTSKKKELINITNKVEEIVSSSKVERGICHVFAPHATAALLINEDEAGFKTDVEKLLDIWIPQGNWAHDRVDNNATAHLAAAMIGQDRTIPIQEGRLQLGTWQEIFFVELDGPRERRKIIVQIVGE